MQLNEAIRQARIDLGLSQKKLAEQAGVQRRQLATLEMGGNVTLSTLRKILLQLPNLKNFSLDAAEGVVERGSAPPSQKSQALILGTDLMIMTQHALATITGGKRGTRELNALRRANEILRNALGYTPERLAEKREALWADEFPGLPTLIADDDETLMAEEPEDTPEEDGEDSVEPEPVP